MLQFHAMADELAVGMYSEHIRAAHEGLFDSGLVCCTIPFGYHGRELPDQKTKRQRPRRALEIDPDAAPWVEQAFRWYAEERLAIGEIVRRFNDDPRIPHSPRGVNGQWTHTAIRYMLSNARYRGWWEYGAAENIWQSKKDYTRRVRRAQPLRTAQLEGLRIVSDALWYQAQRRLADADRSAVGRKPRSGDPRSRPRLIHGLFVCPSHDQILYVGGSHGQSLYCKVCRGLPHEKMPLYSLLPRALALTLTCRTLADLVRQDTQLVDAVIDACRRAAQDLQRPDPARLQGLRSRKRRSAARSTSSSIIPATPISIARNPTSKSGSSVASAPSWRPRSQLWMPPKPDPPSSRPKAKSGSSWPASKRS
jgi:site-specific DNA recombinase